MQHKKKDEVNKKALIWIGSIMLAVIVIMAAMLILHK
jgi:flagellar basal body-associated protein FliL